MRLIDADGLIPRRWNGARGQYEPCVDDAPTIEAIPIEWLKEWARTHLDRIEEYADIVPDIVSDYRKEQSNENKG